MKFNKLYLLVLLFGLLLSVTGVNAVDNITYDMKASPSEYVLASDAPNSYYVDCNNGDDSNNGQSWNSSLKSFNKHWIYHMITIIYTCQMEYIPIWKIQKLQSTNQ